MGTWRFWVVSFIVALALLLLTRALIGNEYAVVGVARRTVRRRLAVVAADCSPAARRRDLYRTIHHRLVGDVGDLRPFRLARFRRTPGGCRAGLLGAR